MSKKQKVRTTKFFNSNLTTTISISLVLFLVGVIATITLMAKEATDMVMENISFTIVLNDDITTQEIQQLQTRLRTASYAKETHYISKSKAIKELSEELGENPQNFLGYNPLQASIEVKAHAAFANSKSMNDIEMELSNYGGVKEIIYQQSIMDMVNKNIRNISIFLACIALLLLVISIGLINNTIRLQLYSKRFLINTMRMVGATSWFIRKPFLGKSILNGIVASTIASVILEGIIYYIQYYHNIPVLNLVSIEMMGITCGIIFFLGIFISLFSSIFAVGKYLHIKTNDLYYI